MNQCLERRKEARKKNRNRKCWESFEGYDECEGYSWYSFGEIVYCRNQLIWILSKNNWESFARGEYPQEPEDIDIVQKGHSHSASFEQAKIIYSDVCLRLENSGVKNLNWFIDALSPEKVLYKDLNKETRDMLNYLSGKWNKNISFSTWLAQRNYNGRDK